MNAAFNLPCFARSCIAIAVMGLLASCGQRGPLYMPKTQAISAPAKPAATPVPDPATAPKTTQPATPADSAEPTPAK